MTDETKVPINLPRLNDEGEDKDFAFHTLTLGRKLTLAVDDYVRLMAEDTVENVPGAFSIGAAFYAALHLSLAQFPEDDPRRTEIKQGFVAVMMANNEMVDLAPTPPTETKH